MGLLIQPDLTLDCARSAGAWVPKTIRDFLADVTTIDDVSERILNLEDYVHRLQDEMNKIDPFKKELPLTMVLLADVISAVKEELLQCQGSKAEPVLEEFIPLKKSSTDDENNDRCGEAKENDAVNSKDKKNWMSSVQLWSSDVHNHPTTDYLTNCKLSPKNPNNKNKKKRKEETVSHSHSTVDDLFPSGKNRTFAPFKGCTDFPVMVIGKDEVGDLPALSLRMPEMKDSKEEKMHSGGFRSIPSSVSSPASNVQQQQQSSRKQRRCWSPELHRRFVNALQQLGGPQAATPKQIRELMQVDGLTNDEVKSHLQKYRVHTRKLPPTANSEQPAGGLWMSSKPATASNWQSSSPQDTLGPPGGISTSAGDSGVEDEDDDKLESRMSANHA